MHHVQLPALLRQLATACALLLSLQLTGPQVSPEVFISADAKPYRDAVDPNNFSAIIVERHATRSKTALASDTSGDADESGETWSHTNRPWLWALLSTSLLLRPTSASAAASRKAFLRPRLRAPPTR